jgi:hypothetical protein
MVMLRWAGEKPRNPYALARAALAHVRKVYRFAAVLDEEGFFYGLKAKIEGADEETLERWKQTGKRRLRGDK